MWVLFSLVDSGIVVYERFVKTMSRARRRPTGPTSGSSASLFGLADSEMPADLEKLDDYRHDMYASGDLVVTDWARSEARRDRLRAAGAASITAPASRRSTSSRSRCCRR